ncbi:MAG: PLP-dependent cysteine synthase family protein [Bacilli bacterium]|nr:PLP-dependent cysteine synthase family protein [Bacilli bacterium]
MLTPLYKITYKYQGREKIIFVKDESKNITGSIKYRPAKYMIDMAYNLHQLDKDTPIIEVTSGNMGIALARVGKSYGNKVIIYMPKDMSKERQEMIKKEGAELVLTKDFPEAFKLATMAKGFKTKQFANPHNADSYVSLAQEIEMKLKKEDIVGFIAGVGTSGTLSGTGSYFKRKNPKFKMIALEPKETSLLTTRIRNGATHEIQGISDGFIPKLYYYKRQLVDQIITVTSVDSIVMAQKLMEKFNLDIGISSGANFLGAVTSKVNKIITVFPDSADRYKTTRLMDKSLKSDLVNQIELIKIETL